MTTLALERVARQVQRGSSPQARRSESDGAWAKPVKISVVNRPLTADSGRAMFARFAPGCGKRCTRFMGG